MHAFYYWIWLSIFCGICLGQSTTGVLKNVYAKGGTKENILYKACFNRLAFESKLPCDSFIISRDYLDVRNAGNCNFYVHVFKDTSPVRANVFYNGKLITSEIFEVEAPTHCLQVILNGKKLESGYNLLSLKFDSLQCVSSFDDVYNNALRYQIRCFEFEIKRNDTTIYFEDNKSNRFSTAIKGAIMRTFGGDKLFLKNIVVSDGHDGSIIIPLHEIACY